MVFYVPLSHGINLGWIFFNSFALAVAQKNQSPLKGCEEREETGFFLYGASSFLLTAD